MLEVGLASVLFMLALTMYWFLRVNPALHDLKQSRVTQAMRKRVQDNIRRRRKEKSDPPVKVQEGVRWAHGDL